MRTSVDEVKEEGNYKSKYLDEVSEEEKIKLIKKRIWSLAFTAGGISLTVAYWIAQLPASQREIITNALRKVFGG